MRPAQRVDSHVAIHLQQTYSECLGFDKIDSQLYCFYPTSIRVYEHFPQKRMPYISEELIISQGKIIRFAVSSDLIALLMDDSKLIVRLRKVWQRVVYDSNLSQQVKKIDYLKIVDNKIIYRIFNQQNSCIYKFIKINPKSKQINQTIQTQIWKTSYNFKQFFYLKTLGNIANFYLGLLQNKISFGTYYKIDNNNTQNLQQFQFGKIKQQKQQNIVHNFYLINLLKNNNENMQINKNNQNIIYLIKIVQIPNENKLIIKYRKFYEQEQEQQQDNKSQKNQQNIDSDMIKSQQDRNIQEYKKMINVLSQINCVKNISENKQKIQGNLQQKDNNIKNNTNKNAKSSYLNLRGNQFYVNCIQDNNTLFIATNLRLFKFVLSEKQKVQIQEIMCFSINGKLIEVCQNKIYIANYSLYVLTQPSLQIENQNKQIKNEVSQFSNSSIEKSPKQKQKDVQDMQIQSLDKQILEKKIFKDVNTQTQINSQGNILENQSNKKLKQNEVKSQVKSLTEISIGQNLPMCPDSHEEALQKINKNLLLIQNNFHKDSMKKIQQIIRKQQDRIKDQINKKLQQLIGTSIAKLVAPLVQTNVQQVFEAKLQQINGYMYSLSMQNLLLLKQEAERNQARQNMLRTELIKSELHQVTESKKAVAQMVQICKKREIQKLLFFEQVKKKFIQFQKKIAALEDKVKIFMDSQQNCQAKIFDEIEVIKIMLKNKDNLISPTRKKSLITQQKSEKIQEVEQKDAIEEQASSQSQNESQQQSSSESSKYQQVKIINRKLGVGYKIPQKRMLNQNFYQSQSNTPYHKYPPHSYPYSPYNSNPYENHPPPQYPPYPHYQRYAQPPRYTNQSPQYYPNYYPQPPKPNYKYPIGFYNPRQDQQKMQSEQDINLQQDQHQKKVEKKAKRKNK